MPSNRGVTGPMPDPEFLMRPIPPWRFFISRMVHNAMIAAGLVGGGLAIGITGYHRLGGLGWVDSFYYASMILSGEGPPPDPVALSAARIMELHLFAGFYALFSGVTFITTVGVLFAPALQRLLHRFHLEIAAQNAPDRDF